MNSRATALFTALFIASVAFAENINLLWRFGFAQATVTYQHEGRWKKIKVLSDPTSYCVYQSGHKEALLREFEETVSSNYSRYSGVRVSGVYFNPAVSQQEAPNAYARAMQWKDGYDDVISNGFVNTAYVAKCGN